MNITICLSSICSQVSLDHWGPAGEVHWEAQNVLYDDSWMYLNEWVEFRVIYEIYHDLDPVFLRFVSSRCGMTLGRFKSVAMLGTAWVAWREKRSILKRLNRRRLAINRYSVLIPHLQNRCPRCYHVQASPWRIRHAAWILRDLNTSNQQIYGPDFFRTERNACSLHFCFAFMVTTVGSRSVDPL